MTTEIETHLRST